MSRDDNDPIQYENEPSRIRKGSEFSRTLFGLVGFRSARDERRGNYPSFGERVRRRIAQVLDK
ncbi:hypothetical protein [Halobaculum sp. MBLA0143]|uniref:hypothetical protein n=1 Tax=Halobaculum sp. MBLA0143 TaxID=3079933 RepID=UPI0035234A03